MKRLIILLVAIVCTISIFAHHISGYVVSTCVNGEWIRSGIIECNLELTITKACVQINTTDPQHYYVIGKAKEYKDSDGENVMFKFIDGERRHGYILLLKRYNGDREVYIQYKDCIIVYIID